MVFQFRLACPGLAGKEVVVEEEDDMFPPITIIPHLPYTLIDRCQENETTLLSSPLPPCVLEILLLLLLRLPFCLSVVPASCDGERERSPGPQLLLFFLESRLDR